MKDRDDPFLARMQRIVEDIERFKREEELSRQYLNELMTDAPRQFFSRDLEEHIKLHQTLMPDSYQSRIEVLDYMYCTIGTGMEWKDGVLQVKDSCWSVRHNKAAALLHEIDSTTLPKSKPNHSFYHLSENFSPLFTIPDDVQVSFLRGALEVVQLIWNSPMEGIDEVQLAINNSNIALLPKITPKLLLLKKKLDPSPLPPL